MLKIAYVTEVDGDVIIPMCEMKPLQFGVISSSPNPVNVGWHVMRAVSPVSFEVACLSPAGVSWSRAEAEDIMVRIVLTIELYN